MESSVDKKIIFAAKGASPSYFAARIAVVAAAGIDARTTDNCLIFIVFSSQVIVSLACSFQAHWKHLLMEF